MAIQIAMFSIAGFFCSCLHDFSPFDGSKILLPFAQKPLAFTNCLS